MTASDIARRALTELRSPRGIWFRARYHVLRRILPVVLPVRRRDDLVRLGSAYGGWVVPEGVLQPGAICYCAGLGEDGSFDLELANRYKCRVLVFDPTPRAVAYADANLTGFDNISFHPVGLWSQPELIRFYAPYDASHVSHSALNLQRSSDYFEAQCITVAEFMRSSGHDQISILKLDIEGSEYAVLSSIIRDGIRPRVLCVEFDQPISVFKTARQICSLLSYGYSLVSIEAWDYTFVSKTDA